MLDLSIINPPETAPKTGRQIFALITLPNFEVPQWGIVQWAGLTPTSAPSWRYQAPGYTSSATLLGWVCEAPFNDAYGDYAIEGRSAWEKHGL